MKFKIKPTANLSAGTQLKNKANIYFDYNTAVITNTAIVDVTPLSVKSNAKDVFHVYPNPVHSAVYISRSDNKALGIIQLLDENGKQIEVKTISNPSYNWNVEQLPNGIYLLKGDGWVEKVVKKFNAYTAVLNDLQHAREVLAWNILSAGLEVIARPRRGSRRIHQGFPA